LQGWERFTVAWKKGNKVAFKGGKNKKYCSDDWPWGHVICNRNKLGSWEKFTVKKLKNGKIALKGGRGKKWCADEGSKIMCNRDHIKGWEKFKVKTV